MPRNRANKLPSGSSNGENTQNKLKFQQDSLSLRLHKIIRKCFFASVNNSTIRDQSTDGSDNAEKGLGYQAALINAEDDEEENWQTDLTVVENGTTVDERTDRSTTNEPARTSQTRDADDRFLVRSGLLGSVTASVLDFFCPRFADDEMEESYQRERWASSKPIACCAVAFLYLNWILYLVFNHCQSLYEYIAFYGVSTFLTIPLFPFIACNLPRKWPLFFQSWLMCAIFFWGIAETIQTRVCDFYPNPEATRCSGKDFLFLMSYAIALPVLVLFGCNLNRVYATIGSVVQFILLCVLILPRQSVFVRNVISYLVFMVFFIFLHQWMESIDRRTFILRAQLKMALKAQQKAQMAQKTAETSKKRFVSYIFHECRGLLNSAMLAYQNLQANDAFKYAEKEQGIEIQALEDSTQAMNQVLNDVLDLQRMDSGRFELKADPFPFHTIVNAILSPLRVACHAKELQLDIQLDPAVEILGKRLQDVDDLWIRGDALRFRQILSNLSSNAVKFTDSGHIAVRTTVVTAATTFDQPDTPGTINEKEQISEKLQLSPSSTLVKTVSAENPKAPPFGRSLSAILPELKKGVDDTADLSSKTVTIRIEIEDSGVGIRPSESSRLFSAFFQTRVGAFSGKGSGLGLAIVRQIVSLAGGRLGVKSKKDKGSIFWFELPFDLASPEDIEASLAASLVAQVKRADEKVKLEATPVIPNKSSAASGSGSNSGSDSPQVRHRVVGWTDPHLITQLSQNGELRFHRPSTAGSRASPKPDSILQQPSTPIQTPTHQTSPERVHIEVPQSARSVVQHANSFPQGPDALVIAAVLPTPSPPLDKLSVLVVDDDGLTRKLLSRMLERMGCVVHCCNDGKEAIDLLLGTDGRPPQSFDLVSLDNSMPVLSGPECVRQLRKAGRHDFVCASTGNALKEDQQFFLEAGADQILVKPILSKDLKEVLRIAQARRQQSSSDRFAEESTLTE